MKDQSVFKKVVKNMSYINYSNVKQTTLNTYYNNVININENY